jgi:hypothetical protein
MFDQQLCLGDLPVLCIDSSFIGLIDSSFIGRDLYKLLQNWMFSNG